MRLRIELEPVQPFVALTHLRFHALADLVAAMDRIIETGRLDGVPVDYLDGVVFSADESYLCVGVQTAASGPVSDYTGQQIYYRSIQHDDGATHDRLTIHDYLWRWDTDWFWCSAAFGAQHPLDPPLLAAAPPAQQLVLEAHEPRTAVRHRRPPRAAQAAARRASASIQDVEVPIERCAEFLDWFLANVPIEPIWLCPLRLRDDDGLAAVPAPAAARRTSTSASGRRCRSGRPRARRTGGSSARSASSTGTSRCTPTPTTRREEFDELYGGETYRAVKQRYDPDSRLLDLYAKAVQRR